MISATRRSPDRLDVRDGFSDGLHNYDLPAAPVAYKALLRGAETAVSILDLDESRLTDQADDEIRKAKASRRRVSDRAADALECTSDLAVVSVVVTAAGEAAHVMEPAQVLGQRAN